MNNTQVIPIPVHLPRFEEELRKVSNNLDYVEYNASSNSYVCKAGAITQDTRTIVLGWSCETNLAWKMYQIALDAPKDEQVWATVNLTWKDIAFKALSCKVLKSTENWVHVKNIACVGSTTASLICKKLDVDPNGTKFEIIEAKEPDFKSKYPNIYRAAEEIWYDNGMINRLEPIEEKIEQFSTWLETLDADDLDEYNEKLNLTDDDLSEVCCGEETLAYSILNDEAVHEFLDLISDEDYLRAE